MGLFWWLKVWTKQRSEKQSGLVSGQARLKIAGAMASGTGRRRQVWGYGARMKSRPDEIHLVYNPDYSTKYCCKMTPLSHLFPISCRIYSVYR